MKYWNEKTKDRMAERDGMLEKEEIEDARKKKD